MSTQPPGHSGGSEYTTAALRLSEATKSAMLNTALDCIITIDHKGMVIDSNPQMNARSATTDRRLWAAKWVS